MEMSKQPSLFYSTVFRDGTGKEFWLHTTPHIFIQPVSMVSIFEGQNKSALTVEKGNTWSVVWVGIKTTTKRQQFRFFCLKKVNDMRKVILKPMVS